jgi:hypothetical protein
LTATPPSAPRSVPLDEVMWAMDVVDTLRHRESLVAEELAAGDRDEALLALLRRTYEAQGIAVPESVLRDGVAALRENRFAYRPQGGAFGRRLALWYVARDRIGRGIAIAAAVVALAWGGYEFGIAAPRAALTADLSRLGGEIARVSIDASVAARAATLASEGGAAGARGDAAAGRAARSELDALLADLRSAFTIRIVVDDRAASGIWRIPPGRSGSRNYYLIVEAIAANGEVVAWPITNEETGVSERVRAWGLRVDEATWSGVAEDFEVDGIIDRREVGTKASGSLDLVYQIATTGGAITRW